MPPVKFFFNAYFNSNVEDLEKKIGSDSNNFARYLNEKFVPGFIKYESSALIFAKVLEDYYISSYLAPKIVYLDSIESVRSEFEENQKGNKKKAKKREYHLPQMIKIITHQNMGFLCLYSNGVITNDMAKYIIKELRQKYNFNFIYKIKNHVFKKNRLDDLIGSFDIEDYTAISVWNEDNLLSVKNPRNIKKTDKVVSIFEDLREGNWSHVKIRNDLMDFELRINNRTQKFLTFENDYINDEHLVKAIDYLLKRIKETEDFTTEKHKPSQSHIDVYTST